MVSLKYDIYSNLRNFNLSENTQKIYLDEKTL